MQTIKINKKTKQEYPVSIPSAWPEVVGRGKGKGRKYASRSKLLGNREIDCRVVVKQPKRMANAIGKAREQIKANKLKRARLAFVIGNPEIKAGPIHDGAIHPRKRGQFTGKIKLIA